MQTEKNDNELKENTTGQPEPREGNKDNGDDGVLGFNADGSAVTIIDTFEGMGLDDKLLRGIYAYGFEKPSATY